MIISTSAVRTNSNQKIQQPDFLRKKFHFVVFVICQLTVTYLTALFYKNDTWSILSVLLLIGLMTIGFIYVHISIYSCLFATISFLPNLNSFLPLGSFSMTWVEICMILSIFMLMRRPLRLTKFGLFSFGLLLSCIFSLIGSPLGLLSIGLIIRFGMLLLFINLLIMQPADQKLFKSFFLGFLFIPINACLSYAGEGVLIDIFSANFLSLERALYSFQYPIWFSILIPLLIYNNVPRFISFLGYVFIASIILLSFARSVIIGTGSSLIIFLIYYKDRKPFKRLVSKIVIILLILASLFMVIFVLKFFEFKNMDNDSNAARYEKMPIAFNKFKQHALFGAGFGASNDKAFADKRSTEKVFEELISPEFGPLTVLAEIGIIGFFFLFFMIFFTFLSVIKILKDADVLFLYKFVILITFGGFLSSFLNSNSISAIIVYLFLCIPIFFYNNIASCKKQVTITGDSKNLN